MFKTNVLNFYGSTTKAAAALGLTHSAVCQWGDVIPEKQAMRLERLTGGSLKYDPALYPENKSSTTQP